MLALVPDSIKPSAGAKSIGNGEGNRRAYELLLLMLGMVMTLLVGGYQFGLSNHTVYLLEPLRQSSGMLANDWFATQTLQYHVVFNKITAVLMRWGVVREVFLLGYFLLLVSMHLGWWRLNRILGGSGESYLLSVMFFYISGAGFGLGLYRFLQDGAFLPSNVANVAMLWGIVYWAQGRVVLAGVMVGVSGLFHLNHAVVGPLLWVMMMGDQWVRRKSFDRWWAVGTAAAVGLCAVCIGPVLREILSKSNVMPLGEFVDLYVRLRHPHHYDPGSWPWWFWAAFLWPFPLAILWFRRLTDEAAVKVRAIFLFFIFLQFVALVLAGIWYVNEWLIQMSLWRFSIYPKLLACIGAAIFLARFLPRWTWRFGVPATVVGALALAILLRGRGFLLHIMPKDDIAYVAMCNWVRDPANTPRDAVFIVPPQEQCFRLYAQRAVVVNFKAIPQLSGELPEWRERLEHVLGGDVMRLEGQFDKTLKRVEEMYEKVPPSQLQSGARIYRARYVIVGHEISEPSWRLIHTSGRYRLYQLD